MGPFLKWFSSNNPTCRYRLRLGIPSERLAATRLADVSELFLGRAKPLGVSLSGRSALPGASMSCPACLLGIDRILVLSAGFELGLLDVRTYLYRTSFCHACLTARSLCEATHA